MLVVVLAMRMQKHSHMYARDTHSKMKEKLLTFKDLQHMTRIIQMPYTCWWPFGLQRNDQISNGLGTMYAAGESCKYKYSMIKMNFI